MGYPTRRTSFSSLTNEATVGLTQVGRRCGGSWSSTDLTDIPDVAAEARNDVQYGDDGEEEASARRAFSEEFKTDIVELCLKGDRSIGQVAHGASPADRPVPRDGGSGGGGWRPQHPDGGRRSVRGTADGYCLDRWWLSATAGSER